MTFDSHQYDDSHGGLLEQKWLQWLSYFLIWTAIGLFFASESALWGRYFFESPPSWDVALKANLSFYYIWALIAPLVLWLGQRFRFERRTRLIFLLVHLPTSVILSALQLIIAQVVVEFLGPKPFQLSAAFNEIERTFVIYFHMNFLTYWVILIIGYARDYYRKFRDREVRAAHLQGQLTEAQLQTLKMQLQPHFLFNALNTVSSLMHRNVEDADRVLTRLGDLLRYSLHNVGIQEVTLREEIDFLEQYLEIEKARFGNRLRIKLTIDPNVLDYKVPNLLLQPLVENAVHYAVATRASGGCVEISAREVLGSLRIAVADDGPGMVLEDDQPTHRGVGLGNTRARLEDLYRDQQRFILKNRSPHGLEVVMVLPIRYDPHD